MPLLKSDSFILWGFEIFTNPQPQVAASTQTVAQSRDAAVYSDAGGYGSGGFSSGGNAGGYGGGAAAPSGAYGAPAPQAAYGAPAQQQQQGGYAQPNGNNGYYYYYYPVQVRD